MKLQNYTAKKKESKIYDVDKNLWWEHLKAEDKDIQWKIQDRYTQMLSAQSSLFSKLREYDSQFESPIYENDDWTANSNIPIEKALMSNLEWELWENFEFKVEPNGKVAIDNMEPIKIIIDETIKIDNTHEKMQYARHMKGKYWYCVWFEWVIEEVKQIKKPKYNVWEWYLSSWKYDIEYYTKRHLWGRVVKPFDFFLDDRAVYWHKDAEDCIEIESIGIDAFRERFCIKTSTWYKSKDPYKYTEYVQPWHLNIQWSEYTFKDDTQINTVTLFHYYNKILDLYVISANLQYPIYSWPNPYPSKELPYFIWPLNIDDKWSWGYWLCQQTQSARIYINRLDEAIMDQAYRNANKPLLVWNWVTFDWQELIYEWWTLIPIDWSINEVRELDVSPVSRATFEVKADKMKEIAMVTGLDPEANFSQRASTAFQAGIQEQVKNKRMAWMIRLQDYWLSDILNFRLQNIQRFYTRLSASKIIDWVESNENPSITIKDSNIKRNKDGKLIITPEKWIYSNFEVKEDDIRWSFRISIVTNSTRPVLKEIEKEDSLRYLEAITQLMGVAQNSWINIWEDIDFKWMLDYSASLFNKELDKWTANTKSKEYKSKIDDLRKEVANAEKPASPTNAVPELDIPPIEEDDSMPSIPRGAWPIWTLDVNQE